MDGCTLPVSLRVFNILRILPAGCLLVISMLHNSQIIIIWLFVSNILSEPYHPRKIEPCKAFHSSQKHESLILLQFWPSHKFPSI